MSTLVVVDGPNVYNDVVRFFASNRDSADAWAVPDEVVARYYREWFDIDRLVAATLGDVHEMDPWDDLGIIIFHSRKALGSDTGPGRLKGGEETPSFWARQGANPMTSCMLVDIPGAPQGPEKGIDTSIVVHLLETSERWQSAVLFSNDADYVPAVWALRNRGKKILCAGHVDDLSKPLVQACQHFLAWDVPFLRGDLALFHALQPGGPLDQLLGDEKIARKKPTVRLDHAQIVVSATIGGYDTPEQVAARSIPFPKQVELLTHGGNLTLQIRDAVRGTAARNGIRVVDGASRHVSSFRGSARWAADVRDVR